jgi:NADH-quinone oxidoreductase subunit J
MVDVLLFVTFAFIAVACGVNLVLQRHPISSALSLIGVMGSLAVLYLLLGAEFIAAAQLIVYAGAIMVLFLFVIMLLNAGAERVAPGRSWMSKVVGLPVFVLFLGVAGFLIQTRYAHADQAVAFGNFTGGGAREVGRSLFTSYLLPFEVVSVLILIAILGAVVLAHREIE